MGLIVRYTVVANNCWGLFNQSGMKAFAGGSMSLKCQGFCSLGEREPKFLQEIVLCLKYWGFHSLSSGQGLFFSLFLNLKKIALVFSTFLNDSWWMINILLQSADFFRADNPEGMEARNEVNILQNDLLLWVDHVIIYLFSIVYKSGFLYYYLIVKSLYKWCHFCEWRICLVGLNDWFLKSFSAIGACTLPWI